MTAASRADRFKTLCKQAAKKLGGKASDDRCQRYATLQLAREAATARLIAGKDVDPSALVKLDESLRQFVPIEVPNLSIEFVSGVTGVFNCQHCGKRNDIPNYKEKPEPLPEPRTIEAKPEAPPEPKLMQLPPSNVVELPQRPRSIHDGAPPQNMT